MVEYPYDARSLLAHPERYAYTQFEGSAYLDAWRQSRCRAIASLPKAVPLPSPPAVFHVPPSDTFFTEDWLRYWLHRDLCAEDFLASSIHGLIRRFEVSKKLRKFYRLPDWQKGGGYSRELGLYALFGILLGHWGRVLRGPCRWIPVNSLIKVNDILVSELNSLGVAASWTRLSLEAEQEILV